MMEWSTSVTEAISKSKAEKTALLVLVEPPSTITLRPETSQHHHQESPKDLYARVATNSIHDRLFLHDDILTLIDQSKTVCLKLEASQTDPNYLSFERFFKLDGQPPNLFLIAPQTGIVLFRQSGYVSPVVFATALCTSYWTISGTVLKLPASLSKQVEQRQNDMKYKSNRSISTNNITPSTIATTSSTQTTTTTTTAITSTSTSTSTSTATNPNMNANSATKSMQIPGQTRLRAKLPNGTQVEKRFDSISKFQTARNWLSLECNHTPSNIQISTVFPRKIFIPTDDLKTLTELDLHPSSSLLVTVLNENVSTRFTPTATTANNNNRTIHQSSTPASASSSWRVTQVASSTYGILSSFVRSFVNPIDTNDINNNNNQTQTQTQGNNNNNFRSTGNMNMNNNNNDNNEDDDQQWLSNGNSTQFGWNPRDVDEDRTGS